MSYHSRKLGSGTEIDSGNVDWSNWGDEWGEPGDEEEKDSKNSVAKHSSDDSWGNWNDAQFAPIDEKKNNSSGKSSTGKNGVGSSKKQTAIGEPNLIDFDIGTTTDNVGAKTSASYARSTSNDGWDAEVWADVEDESWEAIESEASHETTQRKGK